MGRKTGRSKAISKGLQWDPMAEKQTQGFSHFRGTKKTFLLAGSTGHKSKRPPSIMQGEVVRTTRNPKLRYVCNEEMHQKVTTAFGDT